MKLPALNTKTLPVADVAESTTAQTGTQSTTAQTGPTFITPAVEADDVNDPLSEVPEGEAVEGMTSDVGVRQTTQTQTQAQPVQTPQPQQQPAPQPRYTPLSPRLAADDVAKLEELSRTLIEVRALAVTAQSGVQMLRQDLDAVVKDIRTMAGSRAHDLDSLLNSVDKTRQLITDTTSRLDAIDALLQSRGLPTSTAAKRPVLRLHAVRRLAKSATCADGVVTLFYNPRQGDGVGNTSDTQEFTLSAGNVRKVWTGYRIDVPDGYVCDVCIGSDVVSSLMGRGEVEFVLAMTTRTTNRVVSGGSEIARLSLRKIESLSMEISPWIPQ